jgi:8-oxo-dGTP pyrophosphatase MutT (NUDIX family)
MKKIIVVSGPVIVEDEKVLLNKHGDTEFWKFCGGKVEDFETDLIENTRREAQEEMGIEIEVLDANPFFIYTKKETPDGAVDVILAHYLAKRIGEINPAEEIRNWEWIPLEELANESLAPNILPALRHFGFIK